MGGGGAPATSSLGATWQAQLGKVGLEGEGDPGEAWRTARQASGQRVGGIPGGKAAGGEEHHDTDLKLSKVRPPWSEWRRLGAKT